MLLQNRTIWYGMGYQASGNTFTARRNQMGLNSNNNMNRYDGEGNMSRGSSIPNGYRPPYSWLLECEPKYGAAVTSVADLSIGYTLNGTGTIYTPSINEGRNIIIIGDGAIHGYGTVPNVDASLIMWAIATLLGNGQITSDVLLTGKLEAAATLVGEGNIDAAIGAISSILATIMGSGEIIISSELDAKGFMEASITPFTELSPQSLAAGVWNSIASQYNSTGTMGEKLNAAGTAGDPWTTNLSGYTTPGTAGYIVNTNLDAKVSEVGGTVADSVWDSLVSEHVISGSFSEFVTNTLKVQKNKWKIENNQMIIYDDNGSTPLYTFTLKDANGQPTMSSVFERTPV